jgi:hypothetical protein
VPCYYWRQQLFSCLQPVTDVKIISVIRSYNISSCSEIEKLSPIGGFHRSWCFARSESVKCIKKTLPVPSPFQTALDYGADALLSHVQESGEYPAKITAHMLKGSQLDNDSNKWTLAQLTSYLLIRNVASHSRGQTGLCGFTSHTFEEIKRRKREEWPPFQTFFS